MSEEHQGTLVIIGGAEDKDSDCQILRKLANLCMDRGNMVVVAVAAQDQQEAGAKYQRVFSGLGLKDTAVITLAKRSEANSSHLHSILKGAGAVFFTGGDQLRITGMLGGTEFGHLLNQLYRDGTVIAGTSAGAAAMSQTMIIGGQESEAPRHATAHMAPGLGLLKEVVVDQHFAQRGRIGRLLSAIAQNPRVLGLGVDEDTAAFVRSGREMEVVGSGSVTILDATGITHSNLSETSLGQPLALSHVIVHVLPSGYIYDLRDRTMAAPAKENEKPHEKDVTARH